MHVHEQCTYIYFTTKGIICSNDTTRGDSARATPMKLHQTTSFISEPTATASRMSCYSLHDPRKKSQSNTHPPKASRSKSNANDAIHTYVQTALETHTHSQIPPTKYLTKHQQRKSSSMIEGFSNSATAYTYMSIRLENAHNIFRCANCLSEFRPPEKNQNRTKSLF